MAKQFYRKKETGKPDAFYESGSNRYIGPTEFAGGAGWQEVAGPVSPATGPSPTPTTGASTPATTNRAPYTPQPVTVGGSNYPSLIDYWKSTVADPERKRFEDTLAYQRGLRPRDEILTGARTEVGLPDVTAAKERTQGTIDQLNNYLDKLTADLQIGMGQIERTSQPQVLAGRQGAFLESNIAAEKAPISLGLGSASRALSGLTEREQYLQELANQLTDARVYQAEQPLREYEARNEFESQQARDLYNLLATELKNQETGTSEMDELLTPTEAARLGVPYGTTKGEAAEMGKTPSFGSTGSTPTTTPPKWTSSETKDLEAFGALGWSREAQSFLLQRLSATQRNQFINEWKVEQNKKGISLDPVVYYNNVWSKKQKSSTGSSGGFTPLYGNG